MKHGKSEIQSKIWFNIMQRKRLCTICLIAISRDFLEMVLPNPVLSTGGVEGDLIGFFVDNSEALEALRDS